MTYNLMVLKQNNPFFEYQFEFADHVLSLIECRECGVRLSTYHDPRFKRYVWVKRCRYSENPRGDHVWSLRHDIQFS